jgi:hypothetical protein
LREIAAKDEKKKTYIDILEGLINDDLENEFFAD